MARQHAAEGGPQRPRRACPTRPRSRPGGGTGPASAGPATAGPRRAGRAPWRRTAPRVGPLPSHRSRTVASHTPRSAGPVRRQDRPQRLLEARRGDTVVRHRRLHVGLLRDRHLGVAGAGERRADRRHDLPSAVTGSDVGGLEHHDPQQYDRQTQEGPGDHVGRVVRLPSNTLSRQTATHTPTATAVPVHRSTGTWRTLHTSTTRMPASAALDEAWPEGKDLGPRQLVHGVLPLRPPALEPDLDPSGGERRRDHHGDGERRCPEPPPAHHRRGHQGGPDDHAEGRERDLDDPKHRDEGGVVVGPVLRLPAPPVEAVQRRAGPGSPSGRKGPPPPRRPRRRRPGPRPALAAWRCVAVRRCRVSACPSILAITATTGPASPLGGVT